MSTIDCPFGLFLHYYGLLLVPKNQPGQSVRLLVITRFDRIDSPPDDCAGTHQISHPCYFRVILLRIERPQQRRHTGSLWRTDESIHLSTPITTDRSAPPLVESHHDRPSIQSAPLLDTRNYCEYDGPAYWVFHPTTRILLGPKNQGGWTIIQEAISQLEFVQVGPTMRPTTVLEPIKSLTHAFY